MTTYLGQSGRNSPQFAQTKAFARVFDRRIVSVNKRGRSEGDHRKKGAKN